MRKTNFFVRILLVIAVLISMVLSFLIWTNNQRYERKTDTDTTVTDLSVTNRQSLREVYLPTQIITVNADQGKHLIYNHKESLVTALTKLIGKWQFSPVEKAQSSYQDLVQAPNTMQVVYADHFSLTLFSEINKQPELKQTQQKKGKKQQDHVFDRLMIKTTGKIKQVYFLNDATKQVWRSKIEPVSTKKLTKLIAACDFQLPITQQTLGKKLCVFYPQTVSLQPYSYLTLQQNENTYISALLSQDKKTDVDSRESGGRTTYYGGKYHNQLVVDHRDNQLEFTDNSQTTLPTNFSKLLKESVNLLTDVGNPLTDIRYARVDRSNQSVAFRNYVEGFPIFQQSNYGAAKVTFSNSGSHINFSNLVLQVPVPTRDQKVTLPSTKVVLQKLLAAGYQESDFQNVMLGYHWQVDQESNEIVDLIPTYYLEMNDHWQDYRDLLSDKGVS